MSGRLMQVDQPDIAAAVPSWRCPHCRTLQPETTHCRTCSRAAVACGTCHLYRASVVTDLGYCARDWSRTPLSGDEVHPCWEAGAAELEVRSGLFSEFDLARPATILSEPETTDQLARPEPTAPQPTGEPFADDQQVAGAGVFVEAPNIAPGRRPNLRTQGPFKRT
jgi:hypothetical protein